MSALFKNNATATLAAGISSSATTIVLSSGLGALFPLPSSGTYFYGTLYDSLGNYEIVKCTARTTDSLTVIRGQEGTTPLAFATGDGFAQRITAAGLSNFAQIDANQTFTGTNHFSGALTATTPSSGDSTTKVATTEFTSSAIAAALPGITGRIIQSVQVAFTSTVNTNSGSWVNTGHSVTITPTSGSSKILILESGNLFQTDEYQPSNNALLTLYKNNTTNLAGAPGWFSQASSGYANSIYSPVAFHYLDSPLTTSPVTYTIYVRSAGGNANAVYTGYATLIALEIL